MNLQSIDLAALGEDKKDGFIVETAAKHATNQKISPRTGRTVQRLTEHYVSGYYP